MPPGCIRRTAGDTLANARYHLYIQLPGLPDEISREMAAHVRHPNLIPLIKRAAEASDAATALDSVLAVIANRPLRTWTDGDVERFPLLAQSLGQLFLAERNGYLPGLTLSKEERLRSEVISQELMQQFQQYQDHPRILQAAIQKLLDQYRSENSTE